METGLGDEAKSPCAILRAAQTFQLLRLIFLQLRSPTVGQVFEKIQNNLGK
jgi:hypothetical protein